MANKDTQPTLQNNGLIRLLTNNSDVLLSIAMIVILALMIIPLPTWMLDLLLTVNISAAVVILMIALYVLRPLDLSVFPGLLLIMTLFRLSLNVASTRLILGEARQFGIDRFGRLTGDAA